MTGENNRNPKSPGPIVLLTDFGLSDPYVGQMKGVIAEIAPDAHVIDLCHHVPPLNLIVAGMFLKGSWRFFPTGSIFVVVVDPEVGTDRKAIILKAQDRYAVGPCNGCFWPVIQEGVEWECVEITNPDYMLKKISPTFHGRDVFAPVAAHLVNGVPLSEFGPRIESLPPLDKPTAEHEGNVIRGKIIHIDHFGNAWTNIPVRFLKKIGWLEHSDRLTIQVAAVRIKGLRETYITDDPNKAIALINSFDLVEIAWPGASAREKLRLWEGVKVELVLEP